MDSNLDTWDDQQLAFEEFVKMASNTHFLKKDAEVLRQFAALAMGTQGEALNRCFLIVNDKINAQREYLRAFYQNALNEKNKELVRKVGGVQEVLDGY